MTLKSRTLLSNLLAFCEQHTAGRKAWEISFCNEKDQRLLNFLFIYQFFIFKNTFVAGASISPFDTQTF
jgi:hypothetical protein